MDFNHHHNQITTTMISMDQYMNLQYPCAAPNLPGFDIHNNGEYNTVNTTQPINIYTTCQCTFGVHCLENYDSTIEQEQIWTPPNDSEYNSPIADVWNSPNVSESNLRMTQPLNSNMNCPCMRYPKNYNLPISDAWKPRNYSENNLTIVDVWNPPNDCNSFRMLNPWNDTENKVQQSPLHAWKTPANIVKTETSEELETKILPTANFSPGKTFDHIVKIETCEDTATMTKEAKIYSTLQNQKLPVHAFNERQKFETKTLPTANFSPGKTFDNIVKIETCEDTATMTKEAKIYSTLQNQKLPVHAFNERQKLETKILPTANFSPGKTFDNIVKIETCEDAAKMTKKTKIDSTLQNQKLPLQKCTCEICGFTFTNEGYLKQHVNFKHDDTKKLKCVKCGKMFVTSEDLETHSAKHGAETKFKCKICFKFYQHKTDLKRHMTLHTGPTFKCEICMRLFQRKDHLTRHLKAHEKKSRK